MITANIHGVKAISVERIGFGTFIQHKIVFETENGNVEISGFAPVSLYVEELPTRPSIQKAEEAS